MHEIRPSLDRTLARNNSEMGQTVINASAFSKLELRMSQKIFDFFHEYEKSASTQKLISTIECAKVSCQFFVNFR